MSSTALSVAAIKTEIAGLYAEDPALRSYVVQGTTYTTHSRSVVLHACTLSGASVTSQEVQSARLDACAPLIFFLYSYGVSHNSAQAITTADALFSFAADGVGGPLDSASELATLLRSWGIRVQTTTPAPVKSHLTAQVTKLLDETQHSILSRGGVHVTIAGYTQGGRSLAERIVVDMGKRSSREVITQPSAHAEIDVTPTAAYLSGNAQGLMNLIGLTSKEARRVGSRWIEAQAGTKEYSNFKVEDTLAALAGSIFPSAADAAKLGRVTEHGHTVKVLTWSASVTGSTTKLTERLKLTGGSDPLPLKEATSAGTDRQTVSFSRWGDQVTVAAPAGADAISWSSLEGG